jgi:hypothetical protein
MFLGKNGLCQAVTRISVVLSSSQIFYHGDPGPCTEKAQIFRRVVYQENTHGILSLYINGNGSLRFWFHFSPCMPLLKFVYICQVTFTKVEVPITNRPPLPSGSHFEHPFRNSHSMLGWVWKWEPVGGGELYLSDQTRSVILPAPSWIWLGVKAHWAPRTSSNRSCTRGISLSVCNFPRAP